MVFSHRSHTEVPTPLRIFLMSDNTLMNIVYKMYIIFFRLQSVNLVPKIISLRDATLTPWGWVTNICVGNLNITGLTDNGLLPGQHQGIIWTNAGILLIGPFGTNFSEILSKSHIFSFKKMHLKLSSGKWWPFCLGLNVLFHYSPVTPVTPHAM